MMGDRYRVGRKVGRTIYNDDILIGVMDTPELGAMVVDALNVRPVTWHGNDVLYCVHEGDPVTDNQGRRVRFVLLAMATDADPS